jgi:glycosyltransferase involved in cell wall biosynthesis
MYPSKEKPYSGIFVKNQYDYMKNDLNQNIDIYTLKRTFTSKIGSLKKYFTSFVFFTPYFFKKYEVIHLHYFFPMIILAVLYKMFHPKTKVIVTFHGSDINNFINSKLARNIFSFFIHRCNYIISVGDDLSKLIYKKLNRKPNLILSAGINDKVFYKMNNVSKEYDFIFVGSFIKRKGLDILLDAIELLGDKKIRYCFVGSGVLESEILLKKRNFDITLLKNKTQDELRKLYNKSSFFILPSRDEPFGLVVSEAIFCGTPSIVSNIGGMKEQIKNDNNGYILKHNTPKYLAKKIEILYNIDPEKYNKLVKNCRNSNKEYSMNNICNRLIDIYKGVSV